MTKKTDEKAEALRQRGCLNSDPDRVKDDLFREGEFFDPQDLVQVKYEMLRRARAEDETVSQAAADFGFSRPSFYEAQHQFEEEGLVGLVPKKRGPRGGHKLTDEVVDALEQALAEDPSQTTESLVELVRTRFDQEVHRRSVERALARRKKTPDEFPNLQDKADALVDRYEHLRREVLAQQIDSPLALSVFLRQGVVGWMRVQSFFSATVASPLPRRSEAVVPPPKGSAGELTRILTELILTRKDLHL